MDSLQAWLTRFSRLNSVALEARATNRGSTASEDAVLGTLLIAGPVLNPSKLKGLVIQSPAGLTKTLRRLESAGLVRRMYDPSDRRALLVGLTSKGRRTANQALEDSRVHYADLLGGLSRAERQQLEDLVRKVLDRLETATGMPSSGQAVHDPLDAANRNAAVLNR